MKALISRTGALRTGGLLLVAILPALPLLAQQREALPELKSARVVERGSHHAKWETVQEVADPISGETVSVTNSYVQLETGLHYQDERGEWQESSEEIEVQPGAAVARRGPHQVRWAANLNTYGAIEFWTPEGEALRSHVLGLAYFDPANGAHVMIGEVQDSIGVVAGNQVIYADAFDGVSADLHYTYTKGGFVQDVIVREQLPDPALWGFDPTTVQVQVLTEFVALPEPLKELARVSSETLTSTNAPTGRFGAVYQADQSLNFGSMAMTEGRAFGVADTAQERAVPVRKTLQLFEGGRNILVETLDYVVMEPELEALPENSKPTASLDRKASGQQTAGLRIAPPAPTRQWAAVEPPANEEKESPLMARVELPTGRDGYVIDYNLSGTTNNLTLQGDTTYYITGLVTATNVTTIEGGAVVKFANTNNAELKIKGTIRCLTAPYRPAIFTAKDDNSVGSTISGSTGSPSGYYAIRAINIDDNTSDLRHIHIRFARQGVYYGSGSAYPHFLTHVQMVQVGEGVVSLSPVFFVRNGLFHGVITNFTTSVSGVTGHIEHLTSHLANRLNGYSSLTLNVTNSLLVRLTNSSSYNNGGGNAVSSDSGIFASAGAATHYLPVSSPHRDVGVTGISHALLRDFPSMTTETPLFLTNVTLVANTVLSPVALRDTDVPDRGYHYPALDFLIDTLKVSNSTLTLTNGVALASMGLNGIWLADSAKLVSEGGPTRHNIICEYNAVHEQPQLLTAGTAGMLINPYYISAPSTSASFRFTSLYPDHGSMLFYYSVGGTYQYKISTAAFRDCEVAGGYAAFYGSSGVGTLAFDNVLFNRFSFEFNGEPTVNCYNATFHGGSIYAWSSGTYGIVFKDNLFNKTDILDLGTLTHNYNGYANGSSRLTPNQANDRVISSLAFEHGPLGRHYLPAGSILLNNGSRNATAAGLYHHTTQVDQTRETNSVVDIGYHYVAVNPVSVELAKATMAPTGSSTCCSWPASNTTNNLTADPGWVNNSYTLANEYLRIDLGSSKTVDRVGYIPRQYTSMTTDWTGNNNGAYRDYKIYVTDSTSTNPANWGSPVFTGRFNWPNGQERREVEFAPKTGRYVYYYRVNAYGWYGPTDPNQYQNGWPGYAGANEVWIWENRGIFPTPLDSDADLLADYLEDQNGNGTHDAASGETEFLFADSDYDGISDSQELALGLNPTSSASSLNRRLGYWQFNTTSWLGSQGQTPKSVTNVSLAPSWNGGAMSVNPAGNSLLKYRIYETNGNANINLRNGSVRFWFRPAWSSVGVPGGTGPGVWSRLLGSGVYTSPVSYGSWLLHLNPEGTSVSFFTQTNNASQTILSGSGLSFTNGHWYQVVLNYSATKASLFINGVQKATSASGVAYWPSRAVQEADGFDVGSNRTGGEDAKGDFEDLETFNYPLSTQEISDSYRTAIEIDQDGDQLPDIIESGLGTSTSIADVSPADGKPDGWDTDGDGMSDGWEHFYGLNPLSNADKYADPDGDGDENYDEFFANSDPRLNEAAIRSDPPPAFFKAGRQDLLVSVDFTSVNTADGPTLAARTAAVVGPAAAGHAGNDQWNIVGMADSMKMFNEGVVLKDAAGAGTSVRLWANAGPYEIWQRPLFEQCAGWVPITRLTPSCLWYRWWEGMDTGYFTYRYDLTPIQICNYGAWRERVVQYWKAYFECLPTTSYLYQYRQTFSYGNLLHHYYFDNLSPQTGQPNGWLPVFNWTDFNPDTTPKQLYSTAGVDGGRLMYADYLTSTVDAPANNSNLQQSGFFGDTYPVRLQLAGLQPGIYHLYLYAHRAMDGGAPLIRLDGVGHQQGGGWANKTAWKQNENYTRIRVDWREPARAAYRPEYLNERESPVTASPWEQLLRERRGLDVPEPVVDDFMNDDSALTIKFGSQSAINGLQLVRIDTLSKPANVQAKGGRRTAIVWWDLVPGADEYQVFRGPAATGPFTLVGTTANRFYDDVKLNAGSTYHYRVVAKVEDILSEPSASASAVVAAASFNGTPTLNQIESLRLDEELKLGTRLFTIPYAALLAAADVYDPDGDPISFKVEVDSVADNTTLWIGNSQFSAANCVIDGSAAVEWRLQSNTELNEFGGLIAFRVRAFDGLATSLRDVPVYVMKRPPNYVVGFGSKMNGALGTGEVNPHVLRVEDKTAEGSRIFSSGPVRAKAIEKPMMVADSGSAQMAVRAAVKRDGTVWAWGLGNTLGLFAEEYDFQRQQNPTQDIFVHPTPEPLQVRDGQGFLVDMDHVISISLGGSHALAVKDDGSLWSWGDGLMGQLGHRTVQSRNGKIWSQSELDLYGFDVALSDKGVTSTPQPIKGLPGIVSAIADSYASIALASDGSVWWWGTLWGANQFNSIATKYFVDTASGVNPALPSRITAFDTLSPVVQIAASGQHYLALTRDGKVYEFGSVPRRRIGPPVVSSSQPLADSVFLGQPTEITELTGLGVVAVATGPNYSLALLKDGRVLHWGLQQFVPGGSGLVTDFVQYSPVPVSGLKGIKRISVSQTHAVMALDVDGRVWSWGNGSYFQLGRDLPANKSWDFTPQLVSGLGATYDITAGSNSSFVIAADPQLKLAGQALNGSVRLEWTKFYGNVDYTIQRYQAGLGSFVNLQSTKNNSYQDMELQNGQEYTYKIKAYIDGQYVGESNELLARPMAPPGAVSWKGPNAAVSCREIGFDWAYESASGQLGPAEVFNVYRGQKPSSGTGEFSGDVLIASMPATQWPFVDRTVQLGNIYRYKVAAANSAGEGPYSSYREVTFTTASRNACYNPPTGVTATTGDGNINLYWTAANNPGQNMAYRVKIRYKPDGMFHLNRVVDSAATSQNPVVIAGLLNGHRYEVTVSALVNGFESDDGNIVSVIPLEGGNPAVPVITRAIAGDARVYLEWIDDPAAAEYKVEWGTGSNFNNSQDFVPENRFWITSGLANGTTYNFRVIAKKAAYSTSPSTSVAVTPSSSVTKLPNDATLQFSAQPLNNAVYLSWDLKASVGWLFYLERKLSSAPDKDYELITGTAPGNGFIDHGVQNGTGYKYRLTGLTSDFRFYDHRVSGTVTPLSSGQLAVSATPGAGHAVLTWNQMTVRAYQVFRSAGQENENDAPTALNLIATLPYDLGSDSDTRFVDTGLQDGLTYYYEVVALADEGINLVRSGQVKVQPKSSLKPLAPLNLSATQVGNRFILNWLPVPSATRYRVTSMYPTSQTTDTVELGFVQDFGTLPSVGTTLTYKVQAINVTDVNGTPTEVPSDESVVSIQVKAYTPGTGGEIAIVGLPTNATTPTNLLVTAAVTRDKIEYVEFYAQGVTTLTRIGRAVRAPYQVIWENPPKGTYAVFATGLDSSGNTYASANASLTVTWAPELTAYRTGATDVQLPAPGLPLVASRAYDSRDAGKNSLLGYGWKPGWDVAALELSSPLGTGWKGMPFNVLGGAYWPVGESPAQGHRVTITLPDGQVVHFTPFVVTERGSNPLWGESAASLVFHPANPGDGWLTADDSEELHIISQSATWVQGDLILSHAESLGYPYVPASLTYMAPDGVLYKFGSVSGAPTWKLLEIIDRNGNQLNYTYNNGLVYQMIHSNGRKIEFGYSFDSPAGTDTISVFDSIASSPAVIKYKVVNDRLTEVWRLKNRSSGIDSNYDVTERYVYATGPDSLVRITEVYDGRGVRVLENTYFATPSDRYSYLDSQRDAAMKLIDYTLVTTGNPAVETGELRIVRNVTAEGTVRSETETVQHSNSGIVSSVADAAGKSTGLIYDDRGRVVRETDPTGRIKEYEYDEFDRVVAQRDGVSETAAQYDTFGNPVLTRDANGNLSESIHDPVNGNLISAIDAIGGTVDYVYNSSGLPTSERRRAPGVLYDVTTAFTYDSVTKNLEEVTTTASLVENGYYNYYNDLNPHLKSVRTEFDYDANGNRTRETRHAKLPDALQTPYTIITEYAYDPANRLVVTTDPMGVSTTGSATDHVPGVLYGPEGRQAATTNAMGQVTSYVYDAGGNLLETTYPDGRVTRTMYDERNRPVLVQQRAAPNGSSVTTAPATETVYDLAGRVIKVKRYSGVSIQKSIATPGTHFVRHSSSSINLFQLTKTAAGTLESESRTAYDAAGRVRFQGRVNFVPSPDVITGLVENQYDSAGRRVATRQFFGHDFSVSLLTETEFAAAVSGNTSYYETTYGYDAAGNMISMRDATSSHNQTDYVYDGLNRRVATRFTSTGGPGVAAKVQTTSYDGLGRVILETDEAGVLKESLYDHVGNLLQVRQDARTPQELKTTYVYNELGQMIEQKDALGRSTKYAYDVLGRRTSRTIPGVNASSQPLVETTAYFDEGSGTAKTLRKEVTDFRSKMITSKFDNMDRLYQTVLPAVNSGETATTITYAYTPAGQRQTVTSSGGLTRTVYYAYDSLNRLRKKDVPEGVLTYEYDGADNLAGINGYRRGAVTVNAEPPTGDSNKDIHIDYTYDRLNRLKTTTDVKTGATSTTTYTYDNVGNLETVLYPNFIKHSYAYTSQNRLSRVDLYDGGAFTSTFVDWRWAYTLDPVGNRTRVNESSETGAGVFTDYRVVNYEYDTDPFNSGVKPRLYRLTKEQSTSGTPAVAIWHEHDAVGNRTRFHNGGTLVTRGYDISDRIDSDATLDNYNANYDLNGNTVTYSGAATGDSYDALNRLIKRVAGGNTITIVYDHDGHRVSKTVNGATTHYLVDDRNPTGYAQVLGEWTNTSQHLTRAYVPGLDLISQRLNTGTGTSPVWELYYYGYDGLGSVRVLFNLAGTGAQERYAYDAYGQLIWQWSAISGSPKPNRYLFAGEQWDADLGMYYNRARYYRPDAGRFWTMDSYEGNQGDPLSLHKYLYAHANPVMNVDPSGHMIAIGGLSDVLGALGGRGILEGIRLPAINMARAKAVAKLGAIAAAAATTLTGDGANRSNNKMRLQLQEGVNHFWSLPMLAPPSIGVTSTQVRAGLTAMHTAAVADAMLLQFPNALEPQLFSAIILFSQKLTPIVAGGGVIQGGNILREEFVGGGKVYRIDLENLRGHNLRQ